MNTDIRVSISFKNHRKRRKLHSKLGSDGVMSLIFLWLSVAENKPEGVLHGYSVEDIELDAEWSGDSGIFVETLIDCNLLDYNSGSNTYSLHNWPTRQQWVYKSNDRSDKARFSRIAKTHPSIYAELKEKGVNAISKEDYVKLTDTQRDVNKTLTKDNDTLTPAPAPSPSPSPSPSLKNIYSVSAEKIITKLNELGNKNFRFGDNNIKHIIARLKEGFTEEDCIKVLEIKIQDPYFIKNPQHYNPETLFRPSKFEKYLNENPSEYKKDGSIKKTGFTKDYYKPSSTGDKNEFF